MLLMTTFAIFLLAVDSVIMIDWTSHLRKGSNLENGAGELLPILEAQRYSSPFSLNIIMEKNYHLKAIQIF